jgi:hypothetical protein
MPDKNEATHRVGGPGASHENRKQPEKSKPHGQLDREDARSGAHHLRGVTDTAQNKPYGDAKSFEVDNERSRADAGAARGKQHAAPGANRSKGSVGDTAEDDDLLHPIDRKQVR